MNIDIDPKTDIPRFKLSDEDLNDARAIDAMMKTRGWKVLAKYMEVAKESILDAGKAGIKTRGKRDLSDLKWAVLKGWDECRNFPGRIVARAEELLKKEPQEEHNANPDDQF